MEKPKILLVDDNPANIDLLRATLKNAIDCVILVATSGTKAIELASSQRPQLILLDVMMPDMDGFNVCSSLRTDTHLASTPIIFVTAKTDDVSEGFRVGGNDYITKPINADEVIARVNHQLEKLNLYNSLKELNETLENKVRERTSELAITNRQLRTEVKERRYMQDRLQYLASHDFVTHLYNRNALDDFITDTISRVQLTRKPAVLLEIDIDRFRLVNESCGCIAGDELLRQIAELISSHLHNEDFFARLGGDKFAIVCRDCEQDTGLNVANMIIKQLKAFEFTWEDTHFNLSASIALVPIDKEIISYDQLILMADEVLYHLKRQKVKVLSYDDITKHSGGSRCRINWALKIMEGMKHNNFQVYFQKIEPLFSFEKDKKPVKIETLIRLWDPTSNRLIFPDEFIPAAERFNLITDIDRWMVMKVLHYLTDNPTLTHTLDSIAINLSAISIRDANMINHIKKCITESGIEPGKICFEITETEAIVNMEAAKLFIGELHNFGCEVALDDFGSGFSSFNYLRELPFDIIKIDGVFIRDMHRNPSHYAMVRSIVEVAKQLDKRIVAEFVENHSIVKKLTSLGVEWAQGYHYHKPEPLDTMLSKAQAV